MLTKVFASLTVIAITATASAQTVPTTPSRRAVPDVESVYAPPEPPREIEGINEGGVNFSLDAAFMSDYIWRGIDRSESGGSEDSPNLLFDSKVSFNTGRYPHPFIGIFSNIYDSDPASRFQEIRPYFGFDWNLRPFLVTAGYNSYIYPDRDDFNTAEVFGKITLDDSYFFRTDQPIASPYIFAAYDFDTGKGVYLEVGISHDFVIEDTNFTLTPQAQIAYVNSDHIFAKPTGIVTDPAFQFSRSGDDTGFQHWQVGLVATYKLNALLNLPPRWGQFDLKGYLFYTDGMDNDLRADTELWGGMGFSFSY
jgi:hypothetical protein